jgi:MoaA/NifB/PqqE/SkfB family radical SAM enzyme
MLTKNLSFLWSILSDNPNPDVVSINLTPFCNQHCQYCEIGKGKVNITKSLLTKEDVIWIIDQMAEQGISLISIGGGEPLLVPWLWDILSYAKLKGVRTEIISNGMRILDLTPVQIEGLKKTYNISISIDTIKPETQDWLRGVSGAYWKQMMGIHILHDNKIPFTIATVLTDFNYYSIPELVKLVDKFGARFVKFQPIWQGSNFPEVNGIDKSSLQIPKKHIPALLASLKNITLLEEGIQVKTNAGDILDWISLHLESDGHIPLFKLFVNKYRCHTLHSIITINYYGDILPCNYLKPTFNIKERMPLIEAWNLVCLDIRNTFKKGRCFPECNGCTCSIEMGLICSGIRYPISNCKALPKLFKMITGKLKKQAALK